MKRNLFCLLSLILVAVLLIAGCGGGKSSTTSSTTSSSTSSTTSLTSTTTSTTSSTTSSSTSTQSSTTPSSTSTSTTSSTTSTSTTTSSSTSTSTSTTTTSSTTSSTTTSGADLEEIFANIAGVTTVKYDMITSVPGQPDTTTKVWMKGTKFRMEMDIEGQKVVYLIDATAMTMYMYYPDQNMAMKVTYEEPESAVDESEAVMDYNPVVVGHETIDGKACVIVEYNVEGTQTRMWVWEQYGFPIRVVYTDSNGTVTINYKNIDFGNIDDSVFELPAGVQIMEMPTMPTMPAT